MIIVNGIHLNKVETEDRVHSFCRKIIFVDLSMKRRCIGYIIKENDCTISARMASDKEHVMVKLKFSHKVNMPFERNNQNT